MNTASDPIRVPHVDDDPAFVDLSEAVREGEDGTGLGLSIVERVATAHGWSVTVTEGWAGGTRIEVKGVTFD